MKTTSNIYYRYSTDKDCAIIDELLKNCFGDRKANGALDNLEQRYYLAFVDDALIAMTGIVIESPEFLGNEIDWTCILPEYRGKGIITEMIKEVLKKATNDIYCSCLRLYNNADINMKYAMKELGFQCIMKNYKSFNSLYTTACNRCIYHLHNGCVCNEDLYCKPIQKLMQNKNHYF